MAREIFFIGVPRSGTTVIFESFCHHEEVAWLPAQWRVLRAAPLTGLYFRAFSNRAWHHMRYKRQRSHDARGSPLHQMLPMSTEDYDFWQRRFSADMARDFLLGREPSVSEASAAREWIARYLRWSGRSCFIHKFTGPARIQFLRSIFPEAAFVHLVRDPVAVVRSLLSVPFWREGDGLTRPWWRGIPDRYLDVHRERPVPEVLAVVQWKAIVDTARKEAGLLGRDHYVEVRYEDFTSDPRTIVGDILHRVGLRGSERISAAMARRPIRNRNVDSRPALDRDVLANLEWALSRL